MTETENQSSAGALASNIGQQPKNARGGAGVEPSRRQFLLLAPLAALAAIAGTMLFSAFRFLRPRTDETGEASARGETWHAIALLSEVRGDQPILRKVLIEHRAGWNSEAEQQLIYLLPRQNNRVVSATCPHEGCIVAWRDDAQQFICPCHDSRFTAEGTPLTGPATRPLAELPARIENGVIKVRFSEDTLSQSTAATGQDRG